MAWEPARLTANIADDFSTGASRTAAPYSKGHIMAEPSQNAAIWYSADGYDPAALGINGRRMAGQSFLRAFLEHGQVDEFVSFTRDESAARAFSDLVSMHERGIPGRNILQSAPQALASVGVMYFCAPNYVDDLWRRHVAGDNRYSICGINHTLSTLASTGSMLDLRAAPLQEWDGIICTSRSSQAAIIRQMETIDTYFIDRFGVAPPKPQMPIIPLGSHAADFQRSDADRAALRQKLGYAEGDIVISTIARLEPYAKFDPFPLFMALEAAQQKLGPETNIHFLACGYYKDSYSRRVFENGARTLMPSVSFSVHDGTQPAAPFETLSASDIFVFAIDNFQETFGIAPIEAMAAGLPVIATDWDGIKDTVSEDVGIRVKTRMLGDRHSLPDIWNYFNHPNQHGQYGDRCSATIEIDLRQLTQAIHDLASNRDLRQRMGAAAIKRAQTVYDWSVIIPQYQAFWAELQNIRTVSTTELPDTMRFNPVAPPPTWHFQEYATERLERGVGKCRTIAGPLSAGEMFDLRRYGRTGYPPFESKQLITTIFDLIAGSGSDGMSSDDVTKTLGINWMKADRVMIWLLKFGLIEEL